MFRIAALQLRNYKASTHGLRDEIIQATELTADRCEGLRHLRNIPACRATCNLRTFKCERPAKVRPSATYAVCQLLRLRLASNRAGNRIYSVVLVFTTSSLLRVPACGSQLIIAPVHANAAGSQQVAHSNKLHSALKPPQLSTSFDDIFHQRKTQSMLSF